ncbi:PLP-dependent aminotransferase family protein [Anaerorudis cellulosivorans]|uniref:aminotransferase-like domain-containing protein n=1 Tax=Anaerorudis cellulosivorans TaxID=3397862 RepID=UPI002220CDD9|nr:PLP-dependent aminotransferase family protein [Seramator thermalis]MCW1735743.1 PLP-dependent aminotransferase family protein [Seramator thermalis]
MPRFASSVSSLRSSEIRDLMSVATAPDIISFSGGMPGNDLFPLDSLDEIYRSLTDKEKQVALQYGPTNGLPSMLESLETYLEKKGFPVKENRLMMTTGSLQAIHILAKAFIDPGDTVLVENPSFIGALSAFRSYEANLVSVPLTDVGIDIEQLKIKLENTRTKPKFLYYCPNFHNPAGIIYSMEVKQQMIELLKDQDIVLIEDDVYSDLYFYEEDVPKMKLIKAMNPEGIDVCFTGSFSKILGPGLRLGWMLVPNHIYRKCELIKQSIDACSPSISQVIADKFVRGGYIYNYTARVRQEYKKRGLAMIEALEKNLPSYVTFEKPRGGFYIWLHLPEGTDATPILQKALEKGVVFVTGKTFDPDGIKNDAMRVSFCNTDEAAIQKGIPLLAEAIREVCG